MKRTVRGRRQAQPRGKAVWGNSKFIWGVGPAPAGVAFPASGSTAVWR